MTKAQQLLKAIEKAFEESFMGSGRMPRIGRTDLATQRVLAEVGHSDIVAVMIDGQRHDVAPGDVVEVNGIPVFRDDIVPADSVDLGFDWGVYEVRVSIDGSTTALVSSGGAQ